ncbi:MAG: hypothetical protein ACTHMS_14230 [Jatrophihabitans sp.]|uniref:hypothetical protein n=1 Tax=Jatrophihabitans sp. TaxID=1932789 RepID=UPI003F7FE2A6
MPARRLAALVAGAALTVAVPGAALAAGSGAAHTTAPARAAAASTTYVVPVGGVTMLKLAPATAQALAANHVSVRLASEARSLKSGIGFPITGGLVNAKTLGGRITHMGGLTFVAGGKQLTVRDFVINTVRGKLTAYVDQAKTRIDLLNIDLGHAKVTASSTHVGVANVGATLTAAAASALNSYFKTNLFKAGLAIGTAQVSAKVVVLKS